jgi:hypothetical protein
MPDADAANQSNVVDDGVNPIVEQQRQTASELRRTAPFRFSLRALLILTAASAVFLYNLRSGWQRTEQNILKGKIEQGLKVLYFSTKAYSSSKDDMPAAATVDSKGRPLFSWRFRLVPYFEKPAFPLNFDAPWDSPQNSQWRKASNSVVVWSEGEHATNVFALTGSGTAFDRNRSAIRFDELPHNLILLMEVADSNTHWMQPGDYDVTKLLAATGRLGDTVKGLLKDRIHILFADGEVWALAPDTPIDAVKPFLTISAAQTADRDKDLAPYRVD